MDFKLKKNNNVDSSLQINDKHLHLLLQRRFPTI